jgi:nucleotide-binding universal stress UspA family protein/predicted transcriptional regulator
MVNVVIVPFPHPRQDPERIAEAAIPAAIQIGQATSARVMLVSAVDIVPRFDPLARSLLSPSEAARAGLLHEAHEALDRVSHRFGDLPVEIVSRWGNPVDVVLELAEQVGDPVIVLGSRVPHGIDRAFYGSIALQLVREASCPVIVVRGPQGDSEETSPPPLERVLVPLDRSNAAERALRAALDIVQPGTATLHLLHVIEPLGGRDLASASPVDVTELDARNYLQRLARPAVERGHRITSEVRSGRPAPEILAAASDQRADLIVMATHGRSGWSRFIFGSTAERVLQQASAPLLLVRPTGDTRVDSVPLPGAGQRIASDVAEPPGIWQLTARDIMTTPAIVAREDTPLRQVVTTMLEQGIGCLPVVDEKGMVTGLVTEAHFIASDTCVPLSAFQVSQCFDRYLTEEGMRDIELAGETMTAGQVMTREFVAVAENESIRSVARKLLAPGVRQVPVLRGGTPLGVISERDLLNLLAPEPGAKDADG